ncbi:MAG: hypothetical protein LBN26_00905 [Christensenellaceae bacterium]|jgi:hypothetical protein|nr:hypothetical protein [Christensenellaceae bacterium]
MRITQKLLPALLAMGVLCISAAALAGDMLQADPAAGTTVTVGKSITYTYAIETAREGSCVVRFALSQGLAARESSIEVNSAHATELVLGSDGFTLMADGLDAGDQIRFVADVHDDAAEISMSVTNAGGGEDGSIHHVLAQPVPTPEPTEALPAASQQELFATGQRRVTVLVVLGLLVAAGLLTYLVHKFFWRCWPRL